MDTTTAGDRQTDRQADRPDECWLLICWHV